MRLSWNRLGTARALGLALALSLAGILGCNHASTAPANGGSVPNAGGSGTRLTQLAYWDPSDYETIVNPIMPNDIVIVSVGNSLPTGVSDPGGNSYTKVVSSGTGTTYSAMYYTQLEVPNTGNVDVSVTYSPLNSGTAIAALYYAELGNLEHISVGPPVVDTMTSSTGNGTSISCGPIATSNAVDLIIYAAVSGLAKGSYPYWTAPSSLSLELPLVSNTGQLPESIAVADQIVSSPGSYTTTLTASSSGPWLCLVAAFKLQ